MSLPSEVKNTNGEITENGTVVYEAEGEDVRIAVQAISDEQDGSIFDAVRTMVTIENAEAPKEYSFTFNLPKGFSLIKDYDYEDEYDEWDCGAIYIVDENNRTISVIDPA